MSNMYLERLEDLSVFYFVQDSFSSFPLIKVVDGFPEGELSLPTIAIEAGRLDVREFELGNRDGIRVRRWHLDIYAKNKSQRDEVGYKLLDELKNGIPVYNYNEGFPPLVSTKLGTLQVLSKTYDPVLVDLRVVEKLYYRATLSIVAQNDVIQEV